MILLSATLTRRALASAGLATGGLVAATLAAPIAGAPAACSSNCSIISLLFASWLLARFAFGIIDRAELGLHVLQPRDSPVCWNRVELPCAPGRFLGRSRAQRSQVIRGLKTPKPGK